MEAYYDCRYNTIGTWCISDNKEWRLRKNKVGINTKALTWNTVGVPFDEKNIYYYGEDICYSFIMKGGNLCNKIKFHIFIFLWALTWNTVGVPFEEKNMVYYGIES